MASSAQHTSSCIHTHTTTHTSQQKLPKTETHCLSPAVCFVLRWECVLVCVWSESWPGAFSSRLDQSINQTRVTALHAHKQSLSVRWEVVGWSWAATVISVSHCCTYRVKGWSDTLSLNTWSGASITGHIERTWRLLCISGCSFLSGGKWMQVNQFNLVRYLCVCVCVCTCICQIH